MMASKNAMTTPEEFAEQIVRELGEGWEIRTDYPVGIEFDYTARRGPVGVGHDEEDGAAYWAEIYTLAGYHGANLLIAYGDTPRAALEALREPWAEYRASVDLAIGHG